MDGFEDVLGGKFLNLDSLEYVSLTFDLDWAPYASIESLLHKLENSRIKATIFCTHLDEESLHVGDKIELGIHPNFRETNRKHIQDTVSSLNNSFPNAVGERSHCLFSSTVLLEVLSEMGYKYTSNNLMFLEQGIKPYEQWNGIIQIPLFWEDDVHILRGDEWRIDEDNLRGPGLKVFNFHPFLLYLNAVNLDGYNLCKKSCNCITQLNEDECEKLINKERGVGDFFHSLIDYIKDNNIKTFKLSELIEK